MRLADDTLQRIRVHVAQRRLRLDDFFTDFDSLRSGRITAAQFRRALAVNRIHLTDSEFSALSAAFAAPAAGVCYTAFLQSIKSVDPPAALLSTHRRLPRELSPEEEKALAAAMRSMRHAVRVRGLHLRRAFEDFDPFHSGKVTAGRFRRCLPFDALPEEAVRLMLKKYNAGDGDVLYGAWCRDVEEGSEKDVSAAPNATVGSNAGTVRFVEDGGDKSPRGALSVDTLLQVLREQFAMYRLRCDDYLRDYDPLRTGLVSAPQFASALGRLRLVNFHMTEDHINTLTRAYTEGLYDDNETNAEVFPRVNYVQFLADTDPRRSAEVNNNATSYYESTRSAGQFLGPIGDPEYERAEAVVAKVRRLVRSDRIHLVPTLHDFDRARKGIYEHRTCTTSRFERSLATNKIFLRPDEIALLVKRYRIRSADGSPSDEVNYYQFVLDVDQSENPQTLNASRQLRGSNVVADLQRQAESTRVGPAQSAAEVIARIAAQAEERHLRVNEFFIDFDPLRSGLVQTEKFAIALGIAGLHLHEQEVELLGAQYKSSRAADRVDTNRFIADVGAVAPSAVPSVSTRFNLSQSNPFPPNVEASPVADLATATVQKQKEECGEAVDRLTEAERSQLTVLLRRLAHDVVSHHALLTPFFSDFDRFHRGKIPRGNFLQALARHRFFLTQSDSDLLIRFYASAKEPDMVEYTRFVADVGCNESARPAAVVSPNATLPFSTGTKEESQTFGKGQAPWSTQHGAEPFVDEALVEDVLTRICCFLQERGARLSEFFPDGDELRHRHVTNTRFRHCLSILGMDLGELELQALETAFAHCELRGHVDYPVFFAVVRDKLQAGVGLLAVSQRRRGSCIGAAAASSLATHPSNAAESCNESATSPNDPIAATMEDFEQTAQSKLYAVAMDKVRRTLAARRTVSLEAFRQYDRSRKGIVKEGQFFATLMSLGVQLSPAESDAIRKAHTVGGGEMGYTKFSLNTDDKRFT